MARGDSAPIAPARAAAGQHALIVDDHPLYRAGLRSALASLPLRFDEADTLMAAIDALSRRRFDLVLYDWHLPDGGGCKGLVAICQLAPQVPVVVISADEDDAIAMAASSIGAAACLSKSTDAARLGEALGRLLRDAEPLAGSEEALAARRQASSKPLTQRQREVLQLMARGDPNKRIADALGIAESTVRAHVSEILLLMGARNRTEAVIRAQRDSLLGLNPG